METPPQSTTPAHGRITSTTTALLHDLRAPLHAVIGRLDLAADSHDSTSNDTADITRHLAAARVAADHLRRVIDGVTNDEPASLGTVLADAIAICMTIHPDVHITAPSPIPTGQFPDRVGAVRLVLNLLTNCAQHGVSPIDVTVASGDITFIDIDDAGDGVHPSQAGVGLTIAAALAHDLNVTLAPSPRGGWRLGPISPSLPHHA